jgi:hypothetical protein
VGWGAAGIRRGREGAGERRGVAVEAERVRLREIDR